MCEYKKYMEAKWNTELSPTHDVSKEYRNSRLVEVLKHSVCNLQKLTAAMLNKVQWLTVVKQSEKQN